MIRKFWLRGVDLNHRPLGYEPNELPDCSTPQIDNNRAFTKRSNQKRFLLVVSSFFNSPRVKSKIIKSGNAEEAEAPSASSAFRVYGLNSGFTCGSTGGPICVGSKAVWLLRSPPPETVAVLTTFAVIFCGTSTVRVIGG